MFQTVREDRRGQAKLFALALVMVMASAPSIAWGQADSKKSKFGATVVDLSDSTTRVVVPLDRSITVETTVEVASADVIASQFADVQVISPKRLLLTGQRYGSTSVVLQSVEGEQFVFNVAVELDLQYLNESLADIDSLGSAKARSVKGHVVLSGTVSSAERAKRMVELASLFLPTGSDGAPSTTVQNQLEVAGERQVMIRCVVAEVSRSAMRELGINGFLLGQNVKDAFLVNQLGGINPIDIGAAADSLVSQNVQFLTGTNGIPLTETPTLSLGFPRVQTQFFIKAMADNTLLSILAEPNLTAVSGETASFLAGGEFPIPVPQGNQQVTIEFREFGVRLNFTPQVKGNDLIRLRIAPEVSELDFTTTVQIEGFAVPGLTTRSTETTVELGAGQTIAIAGLLNERVRGISSRVPGIGDVPVLGALFRSVSYQRALTELVVLVTPDIVAPLEAHQAMRLPTDGRVDPNETELYMLGLLDSLETTPGSEADGATARAQRPVALHSQPEETSVHGPWGIAEANTYP